MYESGGKLGSRELETLSCKPEISITFKTSEKRKYLSLTSKVNILNLNYSLK
jgi:hypothetical protein